MSKEIDYNSKEVKKWAIFQGMGGGFGGARFDSFETCTAKDAMNIAYDLACQTYEDYEGSHGIRSKSEIMEEEDATSEEADEISNEERESWISYYIEEYDEEKHSQYEN